MSDTDAIESKFGLWPNLIVPLDAQCPHERSEIYGVHARWCNAWLPEPDDKCMCDRVKRRCCECGATTSPSSPQVSASLTDE